MIKRGFTLIELLVVIAIIGLLSAVVLTSLSAARLKADDAQRISELREISKALELYADANNGKYPTSAADSRSLGTGSDSWTPLQTALQSYIKVLPVDPKNGKGEGAMCSNCGEYLYVPIAGGTDYFLGTYLASTNHPQQTGVGTYGPYFGISSGCKITDWAACTP